jgi:hypothetical protein
MLVALAHKGELLASWTYAPALDLMATARRGAGAYINGERMRLAPAPESLRHLDVCTPQQKWWTGAEPEPGSTGWPGPGCRCASSTRRAWSTSSSPPAGARP